MGCDGGTIPRRDELVRVKKKPEQKDKDAETVAKWKHCALTQEALQPPVVSCELGRLYNKTSVIEYLLQKDPSCEVAKHIRSLKDVTELNLTEHIGYQKKAADKGDEYVDRQASRYMCPVVGLEMNGKYRFCYLRCGCVLSERALKEVKSEVCHKCGKNFIEDDIVIINGSEEEISTLRQNMEEKRKLAKLEKKAKKHKLNASAENDDKKLKVESSEPGSSKMVNGTVNGSGSTSKSSSVEIPSKFISNVNAASKLNLPEKAKPDYSIAKDPRATEAFKSLFTSHKKAQNQPQAHWITHNPLYY